MKKLYFLLLSFLISSVSFGQGLEDFSLATLPSSYSTDSFVGNNGITWSYVASRDENSTAGVTAPALMLRRSDEPSKITSSSIAGGIGDFSVKLYKGFTGAGDRQVELFVNGVSKGTSVAFDDFNEHIFTVSGINVAGNIIIEIVNITPKQVIIDDITWTGFSTACGALFGTASYTCTSSTVGDNNDTVTINIPYTGSDAAITSVSTTTTGVIGGDDPAVTADGTVTITGLFEGDAWDVAFNGGDCDGISASGTIPAAECDPIPNTCFDLSTGAELFEMVVVTANSSGNNNGTWEYNAGTYSANAWCGSGCVEPVESWLIFGPLDMTSVTDLSLALDAAKNFTETEIVVAYTDSYTDCPLGSTWTTAQTLTATGSYDVDLSAATGTDVFIGVQYLDDGADGYSDWDLSNVALEAFGTCPSLGTRPTSDCATCDLTLETETYACQSNTAGDNNDGVTVEIPYTGSESTITSLSTTSGGTVGGDDPATSADGTITISGLMEGSAWDLTINGGDCDETTVSGTIPAAYCDPSLTTNVGITGNVDGVYINEIHYDNDGTDVGEFVEVAGPAGTDLSDYTISLYNGSDNELYGSNDTFPLSGTIDDEGSGVGAIVLFITSGLQNGAPDGVSLSKSGSNDIQFLTYEGVITDAGDGPAIGLTSEDIGVSEPGNTTGSSLEYDETSMVWVEITDDTPGDFAQGTLSSENFNIAKFSIFPNPTNTGFVTITSTSNEVMNVSVFDVLGKQVIESTVTNNQLNVSKLNAGVYILKLTQNNASTTKKLVIK